MSGPTRFRGASEMPPMAVSSASTEFNRTGNWRYLRPVFSEKLAPCRKACPAGTDIPRVMGLVADGRFAEAYQLIRKRNPLPAVCGRVCYHACESGCTRRSYDSALSIQAIERFVGDAFIRTDPEQKAARFNGGRVAVIGSGPAGLSCAYFLAKAGFSVKIFESQDELGGMLRLGIPKYRLPRPVLDWEIQKIVGLGVEVETNCRVGSVMPLDGLLEEFEAIFVGTGAHRSRTVEGDWENQPGVFQGLEFLKRINLGEKIPVGESTIVIGGGNTAIDAARTARRLGASPVIVYRRTETEMPAADSEVEDARSEGVEFLFLAAPKSIRRTPHWLEVCFVETELGEPDTSGRRRPRPVPGSEFTLEASSVVLAIGESADLEFLQGHSEDTRVVIGGDAATGPGTVVKAIASGKWGALEIARRLGRESLVLPLFDDSPGQDFEAAQVNFEYFPLAKRASVLSRSAPGRVGDFTEVVASILPRQAVEEARRCVSCGVCSQCDNCWVFCPDSAILKENGTYRANLDYCKGCGICSQECPRGVIDLVQERL